MYQSLNPIFSSLDENCPGGKRREGIFIARDSSCYLDGGADVVEVQQEGVVAVDGLDLVVRDSRVAWNKYIKGIYTF